VLKLEVGGPASLLVIRRSIWRFRMFFLGCHAETILAQQDGNATKRIRRARKNCHVGI
jgi:hypothetical protein